MLDIKAIRDDAKSVEQRLKSRDPEASVTPALALDEERRSIIAKVETLKAKRNDVSSQVGALKREGKHDEADALIQEMGQVAEQIKSLDDRLREVEASLNDLLARMPNLPHQSVPVSMNKDDKVTVREWGEKPQLDFKVEHHLDFCERMGMLDFPRGALIAGSRFPLYKGWGARLEMGLIQFFWNFHADRGYTHIFPPFLGNAQSMYTASQLPKFKDDVYFLENDGLYLNPTSETLLCNLHRDEILDAEQLPIKYAGYTTCFRREAGAAGEEERGLIRMHQFNKVELFKFTDAESSFDELESLVADAEAVLQALGLHYRVVLLPTGDMAGQSVKTYDIEMWIPSQNRYYEVSSISNCTDYQSRRGNIRYRPAPKAKPEFAHTLNGSGLASSRVFAAIVETFQQPDGSVTLPSALHNLVGTATIVSNQ